MEVVIYKAVMLKTQMENHILHIFLTNWNMFYS